MNMENILADKSVFCHALFEKMKSITSVINKMEFYDFEYSLDQG